MHITIDQERQINFINEEISRVLGELDFLNKLTIREVGAVHEHTQIQMQDALKVATEQLVAARHFARNLVDGYYDQIIRSLKAE